LKQITIFVTLLQKHPNHIKKAIISPLPHRDYYEQGVNILIKMFDVRVKISNPGKLLPVVVKDFGYKILTQPVNLPFIYPYALGRKSSIQHPPYAGNYERS